MIRVELILVDEIFSIHTNYELGQRLGEYCVIRVCIMIFLMCVARNFIC